MSDAPKSAPAGILGELRIGICDDHCRVMDARSGCLCAAAADEIERLREEVAGLKRGFATIERKRRVWHRSATETLREMNRRAVEGQSHG